MTTCSLAHEITAAVLVASKAAFLENYLEISTWILDGSSIECHERKRQEGDRITRRQKTDFDHFWNSIGKKKWPGALQPLK